MSRRELLSGAASFITAERARSFIALGSLATFSEARSPRGGAINAGIPPPAAGAGYTMQTFGPSPTLGTALFPFNFFASSNPGSSQNGDGSLLLTGVNTLYNASVCSAYKNVSKPNNWAGLAFGGGAYFEAVFSFTPVSGSLSSWPAWWLMDIEHLCGAGLDGWPGQTNYLEWQEFDIMEFDAGTVSQYGIASHNWYGPTGTPSSISTSFGAVSIGAQLFSQPQKFGLLWIPATSSSQGSATYYLNNVQVGRITWNKYNSALSPPPVAGSSAYSIADVRHFCPILGTSNTSVPMTVYSCSVWQSSTANNLQQ